MTMLKMDMQAIATCQIYNYMDMQAIAIATL